MPQTGPRRNNVAVRLRDEELGILRERSRLTGRSISDLARDLMGLPPGDRALSRLSDRDLGRELESRIPGALSGGLADGLWVAAIHRILESRFPASPEEFLALYAVRRRASPNWVQDGSCRTVEIEPDLVLEIDFGGRHTRSEPGVHVAPRVLSTDRRLPSATIRSSELPTEIEMRGLIDDWSRRARVLAAATVD